MNTDKYIIGISYEPFGEKDTTTYAIIVNRKPSQKEALGILGRSILQDYPRPLIQELYEQYDCHSLTALSDYLFGNKDEYNLIITRLPEDMVDIDGLEQ